MQILSSLKVDTREEQILQILLDKHCRIILGITKENAMTAAEICSNYDISPSTIYRKLKLLQKLNLLHVTYTIRSDGKKSSSFQSKVININIALCENQLPVYTNFASLE